MVKGPNLFDRYLNNPEYTQQSFTEDGWFKTGDNFSSMEYQNH